MKFNLATVHSDVGNLRAEIAALNEEKVWISTAQPPKADLLKTIHAQIDANAAKSRFNRIILADRPEELFMASGNTVDYGGVDVNIGPLLCDLFGDEIKQKMATRINSLDYEEGPPPAERRKLTADIDRRILAAEKDEESLIVQAEAHGLMIDRRPDANMAVILEVHE